MQIDRKKISFLAILLSLPFITVATPGLSQENSLNFISEVKGDVNIQRSGRKNYQKAYGGELLDSSDSLQLGKGASTKVVCNNLFIWNIQSPGEFSVSSGCPSTGKPVLIRNGSERAPTRAPNDPAIPYIINPRDTAILSDKPTLRWNAVKGANSYQVQVRGPGVNWTTEVKQPEVVYSGKETLQPGSRYRVIVTADNGVSSESEAPAGFTLLSEEDAKRVKAEIIQLQKQPLRDESKTLALAYLYKSKNLNAAAIDLLAGLVKQGSRTTSVYQLLGSVYQQVGLHRLAKEQYLTALKLAKAERNLEAQAIIQTSLGEIDIVLDNLQQAFESLQAAQSGYRNLGDEQQVQQLQQKLDDLKGRLTS
ncbi:fibronectin type III domain-containing protein [Calothrix sp. FACHB-1219]|uniref:tetratricopeptide repeat protein n=1 Tax=Calothrix sp. FACHB-1219 TaxID=2692778 RepID=UPI001686986E|nr:fibronectin type III domain-containing protein [Calothrix sp. FACHB-1219]MBD2221139.1 fibronectin type III domain-containing protein [Calothrix sp. FACHB-1219]